MNTCSIAIIVVGLIVVICYIRRKQFSKFVKMRNMYICTHHFVDSTAKLALIDYNSKVGTRQIKQVLSNKRATCLHLMILSDENKQVSVWEADSAEDILFLIKPFEEYYRETTVHDLTEFIDLS